MTSWSTFFRRLIEADKTGASPDAKNGGIKTTHWFWGAANKIATAKDQNQIVNRSLNDGEKQPEVSAEKEVNDIILQSPQISGPALVNAMAAKGLKAVKATESKQLDYFTQAAKRISESTVKREADSATVNVAVLRKESAIHFNSTVLKEAAADDGIGPTRFKVILLQEGLGNMRDAYYYSKEALESSISVFTGSKIYADHPSSLEEETRPERSVRDVLGHFENIQVEESDGRSILTGEVCILADKPFEWARGLMRHAIEHSKKFPEKNFIGLSINASGDAEELPMEEALKIAPEGAKAKLIDAQSQGITTVKIVSKINSAVSCDLVTEAGAGGMFLSVIK